METGRQKLSKATAWKPTAAASVTSIRKALTARGKRLSERGNAIAQSIPRLSDNSQFRFAYGLRFGAPTLGRRGRYRRFRLV
jgi:hypothetical protein